MSADDKLPTLSSRGEIEAFVKKSRNIVPRSTGDDPGRLIFALDATASRQPTWDRACGIQGKMFEETVSLGGLEIQLCFYRGIGEFGISPWYSDSASLLRKMSSVFCLGGLTQIRKVLRHTLKETRKKKVDALVFIGDCVEEDPDQLCKIAGQLGILGVPVFLFCEGGHPDAVRVFTQIAKLTNGACCPFDQNSPQQLSDLLSAIAVYVAGGIKALRDFSKDKHSLKLLTDQVSGN